MQPFILYESTYTEEEASRAREIRKMEESERKEFRIKYFEIETGKKFPTKEPIEICFNQDTAFMSSSIIESTSAEVLNNGLLSRTKML
jgi:hypothetical protein